MRQEFHQAPDVGSWSGRYMELAAVVEPLFQEFSATRGASERAACLVALTRIAAARKAAPQPSKEAA